MIADKDRDRNRAFDAVAVVRRSVARAEAYVMAQLSAETSRLRLHPCDWGASLWEETPGLLRLDMSGRLRGDEVPRAAVDAYVAAFAAAGLWVVPIDNGDGVYGVQTNVDGHRLELWAVVDRDAFLRGIGEGVEGDE